MDWIDTWFSVGQQALFEAVVRPAMFAMGLGNLLEDGYVATGWLLVGLLQILAMQPPKSGVEQRVDREKQR